MDTHELKEIFSDESFVRELFALETPDEVQSALKATGIWLSRNNILTIRSMLEELDRGDISLEQLKRGELTEEMLELVAGGTVPAGAAVVASMVVCVVADVTHRGTGGGWLSGAGTNPKH